MKKLVLALCMLPSIAAAEYMPRGCYVAFDNPDYCWQPRDGVVQWLTGPDRSNQGYLYGGAVETIIYHAYKLNLDVTAAVNEQNACIDDYNALYAQNTSCVDQYNALVTPYNKNLALIKKLRRACGVKCKKIK